jgi:hypothetical protein
VGWHNRSINTNIFNLSLRRSFLPLSFPLPVSGRITSGCRQRRLCRHHNDHPTDTLTHFLSLTQRRCYSFRFAPVCSTTCKQIVSRRSTKLCSFFAVYRSILIYYFNSSPFVHESHLSHRLFLNPSLLLFTSVSVHTCASSSLKLIPSDFRK